MARTRSVSAITDRFARARQLSRTLFPSWSRSQRARWVVAKLRAKGVAVAVSAHWPHDRDYYICRRTA